MRQFTLVIFLILALNLRIHGQGCDNYIITFDNEKICGKQILYKKPPFKIPFFQVDTLMIKHDNVMFAQIGGKFFANIKELRNGSTKFVERDSEGDVNVYSFFVQSYNSMGMPSGGGKKYYINRGLEPLKKANMKNLKLELADDPESMKYLQKVKIYRITSGSLQGVGFIIGTIGAVNFLNPDSNNDAGEVLMAVGFGSALIFGYVGIFGPDPIKAVEIYNNK